MTSDNTAPAKSVKEEWISNVSDPFIGNVLLGAPVSEWARNEPASYYDPFSTYRRVMPHPSRNSSWVRARELTHPQHSLGFGKFGDADLNKGYGYVYVRTHRGGWNCLTHLGTRGKKGLNLMSSDIPTDISAMSAATIRESILRAAEEIRDAHNVVVPILPITNGSLTSLMRRYFNANRPTAGNNAWKFAYDHITVVHQVGLEALFKVEANGHTHYYLSAFDEQETPPLYFLCQIPHEVKTIAAAREALKPASVVQALAEKVSVKRQGDLFGIDTDFTDADIEAMGGVIHRAEDFAPGAPTELKLYGTSHIPLGLERAVLPNGLQLAKGGMKHRPDRRAADHAPVQWEGWRYIMKNTVPVQGDYRPEEEKAAPTPAPHGGAMAEMGDLDRLRELVRDRVVRDMQIMQSRDDPWVVFEWGSGRPIRTPQLSSSEVLRQAEEQAQAALLRNERRAAARRELSLAHEQLLAAEARDRALAARQAADEERAREESVRLRRNRWRFWR